MTLLGHNIVGTGPCVVIVLNDWMCDTSTWDGARAYLDTARFTWAYTDLRGYGRSKEEPGSFTLDEAAADVIATADANGWSRISIVGHSMSTLVALDIAQHHPDRVERVVLVTPPPPTGFGVDDAMLEATRAVALGNDDLRGMILKQRFGARLSPGWTAHKASRWRATANPEAAAGYVAMFARDGLSDRTTRITVPVLAVTGEQDAEPMRSAAITQALSPLCDRLVVIPIADAGHYPMQETPPLLVAHVERFLAGESS